MDLFIKTDGTIYDKDLLEDPKCEYCGEYLKHVLLPCPDNLPGCCVAHSGYAKCKNLCEYKEGN